MFNMAPPLLQWLRLIVSETVRLLDQYKTSWFVPNFLPERPSGAQYLELAVGKQAAVEHPIWSNPLDISPGYWKASFQVQWRRVHEYAESWQFFANSVINMFNKICHEWRHEEYLI